MRTTSRYITFNHLFEERANKCTEQIAYTFLKNGEEEQEVISYGDLYLRSLAIANELINQVSPGDRALLLYAPGIEYIAAFLGCLKAGVIAVPVYPPQGRRTLPRLKKVAEDASPSAALTDSGILRRIRNYREKPEFLDNLRIIVSDEINVEPLACEIKNLDIEADSIAFLQYTSGSTGSPKGVILTHQNLLSNQQMIQKAFGHDKSTIVCSWLPPYHDMGLIGTILQPLYLGIPCILMSPVAFMQKPFRWLQTISKYNVTTSGAPNFAYDLCVDKIKEEESSGLDLSSWDLAFNGSEPVRTQTLDRFTNRFSSIGFRKKAFYPCYGLAEATLIVSGGKQAVLPTVVPFDKKSLEEAKVQFGGMNESSAEYLVGCGHAVNQEIAIVDPETMVSCPKGQVGEIWVNGNNIAKGYWKQPEETAQILNAQLNFEGDKRWLRTGDLGFIFDTELFVMGRLKDLIIIHGRNYHPGDIEHTAQQAHSALQPTACVAFSVQIEEEEKLVVVQEIRHRKESMVTEASRAIQEAVWKVHEIGIHEVVVVKPGEVPKTSSGKVQRNLCKQRFLDGRLSLVVSKEAEEHGDIDSFLVPQTVTQKRVAEAFMTALKVKRIGLKDNFFGLGGDSLKAAQVSFDLSEAFATEFPHDAVIEYPTVEIISRWIEGGFSGTESTTEIIRRRDQCCLGSYPMSLAQNRLWVLTQLEPKSNAYHIPVTVRLKGDLNVRCLQNSFKKVIERHECLRSTVSIVDGEAVMKVHGVLFIPFVCHDFSALEERVKQQSLDRLKNENAGSLFNLERGPLVRIVLVRVSEDEHLLMITTHHIVSDGWSFIIFFRDLARFYHELIKSGNSNLPCSEPQIQYGDYAYWQRNKPEDSIEKEKLVWWKKHLENSASLRLPTRRISARANDFRGGQCAFTIEGKVFADVKNLAAETGATLFTVLLTIYKILLHRLSGEDRIMVGFPAANRGRKEWQDVVGMFVNTLVTQIDFTDDLSSFEAILQEKNLVTEALKRQETPLETILEIIRGEKEGCRHGTFLQVFFNMLNLPFEDSRLSTVKVDLVEEPYWGSKFQLTLYAREQCDVLYFTLLYDNELFTQDSASEILVQYKLLLEQISLNPRLLVDDYSLISKNARNVLPDLTESIHKNEGFEPAYRLFERQTILHEDEFSLIDSEEKWTYKTLNERANKLAHFLIEKGVERADVVVIYAQRSAWLPCAILGIHKVGAAFAILDPSYPSSRLIDYLKVADPKLLIAIADETKFDKEIGVYMKDINLPVLENFGLPVFEKLGRLFEYSSSSPDEVVDVDDLAYLTFTSGTTGVPLSIESEHKPLTHFLHWYFKTIMVEQEFGSEPIRFGMLSGLAHDPLLRDIFVPLCSGNTVYIPDQELYNKPKQLFRWIKLQNISIVHISPALWRFMCSSFSELEFEAEIMFPDLKMILFGGDILHSEDLILAQKFAPQAKCYNTYGCSETPQIISFWNPKLDELESGYNYIGNGIDDVELILLNQKNKLCGIGEIGEIYVKTPYLSRGYRNADVSVNARYAKMYDGQSGDCRLFKTCDLGRYSVNGVVEIMGRLARRVKIRGFLVCLDEIEAIILTHPMVESVCVVSSSAADQSDIGQEVFLKAFVTLKGDDEKFEEIRRYLVEKLPMHMLPNALIALEAMPLTANGKTDRKALVRLDGEVSEKKEIDEDLSDFEHIVQKIFEQTLDFEGISKRENFFQIGGHSLKAVKAISSISDDLGIDLSLKEFFENPTIEDIALLLASKLDEPAVPLKEENDDGKNYLKRYPLSFSQTGIYAAQALSPDSAAFNMPSKLIVEGRLDVDVFKRALERIIARHDSLRTNFHVREEGIRQEVSSEVSIDFERSQSSLDLLGIIESEFVQPFDLNSDLLLRIHVVECKEDQTIVLIDLHHIIADGRSLEILIEELSDAYNGFPLCKLENQYRDYIDWLGSQNAKGSIGRQLEYWLDIFKDYRKPRLPYNISEQGDSTEYRNISFKIEGGLYREAKRFCEETNVTMHILSLAAYSIVLSGFCGQKDVAIGSPVIARGPKRFSKTVGMFVNTIAYRCRIDSDKSVLEYLLDIKNIILNSYDNRDCPFELLVKHFDGRGDSMVNPIFDTMLTYHNFEFESIRFGNSVVKVREIQCKEARFDLHPIFTESDGSVECIFEFCRDRFEIETIDRLAGDLRKAISLMISDSSANVSEILGQKGLYQDLENAYVNILANYTADPMVPHLNYWMREIGIVAEIDVAPYNQIHQQIIDQQSRFWTSGNSINIILIKADEWADFSISSDNDIPVLLDTIGKALDEFVHMLESVSLETTCIVCFSPVSPRFASFMSEIQKIENNTIEQLNCLRNVYSFGSSLFYNLYQLDNYFDEFAYEEGKIPYTEECYAAIGTSLGRSIYALRKQDRKVIALDCDGTLWKGICGELGTYGIQMDEGHRYLNEFMIRQQEKGVLLCLCSRNNEKDVLDVIDRRDDVLIDRNHLVAWRINWESKSANLLSIAQELNLGVDSFIFIDDDPIQCAEVERSLPEVLVLQLPNDSREIKPFLDHIWDFDKICITEDDRKRTSYYRQNVASNNLKNGCDNLDDFIKKLNQDIRIKPIAVKDFERVAQLTQRTNQFNLNGSSQCVKDIERSCNLEASMFLTVKVCDRFGDYGIVGAIYSILENSALKIEMFVLSCRILGRNVEEYIIEYLWELAVSQDKNNLVLMFRRTEKNGAVMEFLKNFGFYENLRIGEIAEIKVSASQISKMIGSH